MFCRGDHLGERMTMYCDSDDANAACHKSESKAFPKVPRGSPKFHMRKTMKSTLNLRTLPKMRKIWNEKRKGGKEMKGVKSAMNGC